ncbi:hypothetical protein GBL_2596 [Geobacillus kaustophilus GBlys]|uniref:Uncharacterized protein n=1 Tax=Geobacillus kaustophilus GBlys TaxID=1337888 RepID=U2Y4Y6_GEOKU|nr:hypothetical protein GBL_2596 [Geobacillus kaustophilus GBlys]
MGAGGGISGVSAASTGANGAPKQNDTAEPAADRPASHR